MKKIQLTIQQSPLNKALQICSRALSDNNILPINAMYLFDIDKNKLTVSACDMRISISTSIDIQCLEVFKIAIPGKKLADYIAKSANELMAFEIEKHIIEESREMKIHPVSLIEHEVITPEQVSYSVTIKAQSGKCTIPCELGDFFPKMIHESIQSFTFASEDLLEGLYKTMFAISDDQLRPSATGLNIRICDGKIVFTSLNFDMVAMYSYDGPEIDANFIIPKKSLQQIQSLSPTGNIAINLSKRAIDLNFNDISTTSLLIDEKYPDVLSITPIQNDIDLVTSRAALINSLKRILPFGDTCKLVKMNISINSLVLLAENIDFSEEASETIACVCNESILIGVNGNYLLDVLNSLTDDKIWFSFSNPKTAIIITECDRHVNPSKENMILMMPLFIL